jgi:hypothetical protein
MDNDSQEQSETPSQQQSSDSSPQAITVYAAQLALHKKITRYERGGIKGVWRGIRPIFKIEQIVDPSGIKGIKDRTKIREETFRRQVGRLKLKHSANENMTFGVKGNILLLLEVFRILGIKTIEDLFGEQLIEENINAINIETK